MKKIILNILTPLSLICGFLILLMTVCSLIFSSGVFDVNYAQTFASYLGNWAPDWILSVVTFLMGVSVVLIIADKKWWISWLVLIIATILPLYAFIMEHYIIVSPLPEWENGIILGDSFVFTLFIVLEVCAVAALVATLLLPDTSETKANN